ncbi:hypothetical protein MASSI9I_70488 [Massilia sp. 9I]|nr:hypothetical protein MASSI9I_70488 [Massilia sp. 9I]
MGGTAEAYCRSRCQCISFHGHSSCCCSCRDLHRAHARTYKNGRVRAPDGFSISKPNELPRSIETAELLKEVIRILADRIMLRSIKESFSVAN